LAVSTDYADREEKTVPEPTRDKSRMCLPASRTGGRFSTEFAGFYHARCDRLDRARIIINTSETAVQIGALPSPGSRAARLGVWAQRLRASLTRLRCRTPLSVGERVIGAVGGQRMPRIGDGPILVDRWKPGHAAPADGPLFVAMSVFEYDRYRDLPGIALTGARLRRTWPARQGAVALLQWTQLLAKRTGSLSVWTSEADLMRFLRSPEHTSVMRRWRGRMSGTSHRWEIPHFSRSQLWRDARRRLDRRISPGSDR
jgi:hypothetical protein